MNKKLFVLGGALLCAVVTYASVLAVKNKARQNASPNATQDRVKPTKGAEVRKVSTDAVSTNLTSQEVVGPAVNVPDHVVYMTLFRFQNLVRQRAEKAESRGEDSSFHRKYYQREANLDDRQAAMLNDIATQCELEVKAIEAEAQIVINRLRAERAEKPVRPDEPVPPPSPELLALQQRRNNVVLQARDQLKRSLGPSSFSDFEKYVREKVASQIKPKSPDTLRTLKRDSPDRQPQPQQ